MNFMLFSTPTATSAQQMANALQGCGVSATIRRLPAQLARQGCGYALQLSEQSAGTAYACLQGAGTAPKHIYRALPYGYEEVSL